MPRESAARRGGLQLVRDGLANRRRGLFGPRRHGLTWPLLALIALAATSVGAANDAAPSLDLAPYKGRVVVVDFWAWWCPPCRRAIPWLNQMRAKYGDRGLVVIGVNVDKDGEDAARFLREVPIDFDVVYDPAGARAAPLRVRGGARAL